MPIGVASWPNASMTSWTDRVAWVSNSLAASCHLLASGIDLGIRVGLHAGSVSFGDFGAENRIAVTILGATVILRPNVTPCAAL